MLLEPNLTFQDDNSKPMRFCCRLPLSRSWWGTSCSAALCPGHLAPGGWGRQTRAAAGGSAWRWTTLAAAAGREIWAPARPADPSCNTQAETSQLGEDGLYCGGHMPLYYMNCTFYSKVCPTGIIINVGNLSDLFFMIRFSHARNFVQLFTVQLTKRKSHQAVRLKVLLEMLDSYLKCSFASWNWSSPNCMKPACWRILLCKICEFMKKEKRQMSSTLLSIMN